MCLLTSTTGQHVVLRERDPQRMRERGKGKESICDWGRGRKGLGWRGGRIEGVQRKKIVGVDFLFICLCSKMIWKHITDTMQIKLA